MTVDERPEGERLTHPSAPSENMLLLAIAVGICILHIFLAITVLPASSTPSEAWVPSGFYD